MDLVLWGSIFLAVYILLFIFGWLLFQQAKSDLTARAAQMPVLTEVKGLYKNVSALLEQIQRESTQTSFELEGRLTEARALLGQLDTRLEEARSLLSNRTAQRKKSLANERKAELSLVEPLEDDKPVNLRHQRVYDLTDDGVDITEISRQTGFSAGEVELILGLRKRS